MNEGEQERVFMWIPLVLRFVFSFSTAADGCNTGLATRKGEKSPVENKETNAQVTACYPQQKTNS